MIYIDQGLSDLNETGVYKIAKQMQNEKICEGTKELYIHEKIYNLKSSISRRIIYILWINAIVTYKSLTEDEPGFVFCNYVTPLFKLGNAKYYVVIHDMTPWKSPESESWLFNIYLKNAIKVSCKVSDKIITVSKSIKYEIRKIIGVKKDRIFVYRYSVEGVEGYDISKIKARFKKPMSILFVGTVKERKNIRTLIKAVKRIKSNIDSLHIVGKCAKSKKRKLQSNCGCLKNKINIHGYVSAKRLNMLYKKSSVFAYPSKYEGLGIPLIEAMSHSLPIIASDIEIHREVGGEALEYYGSPKNTNALKRSIKKYVRCGWKEYKKASHKSYERFKKFNEDRNYACNLQEIIQK